MKQQNTPNLISHNVPKFTVFENHGFFLEINSLFLNGYIFWNPAIPSRTHGCRRPTVSHWSWCTGIFASLRAEDSLPQMCYPSPNMLPSAIVGGYLMIGVAWLCLSSVAYSYLSPNRSSYSLAIKMVFILHLCFTLMNYCVCSDEISHFIFSTIIYNP